MNKAELTDLMAECYGSLEVFCQAMFPAAFTRPFTSMHREVFSVLEDRRIQKIAIVAPRGFGKSTTINMAYPAWNILFREKHYIVPISCSASKAIEHSENLKNALRSPNISHLFGDIKSKDDPFSKTDWMTASGIKVMPRGAGQQVRGSIQFERATGTFPRPDLFVIDDLEDDEAVESEDQRKKLRTWFYSSVMNSVDRTSTNWRIVVIGTILHEDSLLSNLMADKSWTTLHLDLCDDQFNTKWPEYMSTEAIKASYEEYREAGMADVWYRENRGIPISLQDQGFKQEYFRKYSETEEELNTSSDVINVVLWDPAKTMSAGSCKTAITGLGFDTRKHRIYVRRCFEGVLSPTETQDMALDIAKDIHALILAPEVTGLNEYLTQPLRNEISKRGDYYVIVEVKPREAKTGPKRSGGLIPYYRRGEVLHNPNYCGALEKYLMQWPRPKSWDLIDSLSSIIFVLEEGEQYFEPVESEDPEEDYKLLDYEEPLDMREFAFMP